MLALLKYPCLHWDAPIGIYYGAGLLFIFPSRQLSQLLVLGQAVLDL